MHVVLCAHNLTCVRAPWQNLEMDDEELLETVAFAQAVANAQGELHEFHRTHYRMCSLTIECVLLL
jgi:hypothetical protein